MKRNMKAKIEIIAKGKATYKWIDLSKTSIKDIESMRQDALNAGKSFNVVKYKTL